MVIIAISVLLNKLENGQTILRVHHNETKLMKKL